jgi:hypothetical protein
MGKTAWPVFKLISFKLYYQTFPKKIPILVLYIGKIKTNSVLRFRQLVPFCFLFVRLVTISAL